MQVRNKHRSSSKEPNCPVSTNKELLVHQSELGELLFASSQAGSMLLQNRCGYLIQNSASDF